MPSAIRRLQGWQLASIGALLAAVAVALVIVGLYAGKQVNIDKCLDSGGSYNYSADACTWEHTRPESLEHSGRG